MTMTFWLDIKCDNPDCDTAEHSSLSTATPFSHMNSLLRELRNKGWWIMENGMGVQAVAFCPKHNPMNVDLAERES